MKRAFKITCFIFIIGVLYCIALTTIMLLTTLLLHLFFPVTSSIVIGGITSVFITLLLTIYIDYKFNGDD